MPFSPKVERALENIRRAFEAGRMPHALLVSGHPRGAGMDFTLGVLEMLFPGVPRQRLAEHADIRWVEPEGKARLIRVDEKIRPLIQFIGLTSYEGGWKVGVVLFADRMNENSQNALLKTLEEPPPHSLLVLVTDIPAALLTTIRSRSQQLDVMGGVDDDAPWKPAVLELLREPPPRRGVEVMAWTDRLTAPLRSLNDLALQEETDRQMEQAESRGREELSRGDKDVIEGRVASRVKEMREELLRMIQLWQRDVLAKVQNAEAVPANFPTEEYYIEQQAAGVGFAEALRRVEVVDEVRTLLEHNIRESVVLVRLAREISVK